MHRAPVALASLLLLVGCHGPVADKDDAAVDDDDAAVDDDDTAVYEDEDEDDDDDDSGEDDDSAPPENRPPEFTSEPQLVVEIPDLTPGNFPDDKLFLSSSRTDEVRVYDATTLAFEQTFTHALFSDPVDPGYKFGPNGMAFNERGNLVVAAYTAFIEFSDFGVEYATYAKVASESTENVIFDRLGNLYTTTATGGSDQLHQYDAANYAFVQTIPLPVGAGQLTGITFDGNGRLYLASQTDNTIHVAEADPTFTTFTWVSTISGAGNPGYLEGLQFSSTGELIAAAGDLVRYNPLTGERLGSFDAPGDAFPVAVRVDNQGFFYTADFEDGNGTEAADIFRFTPDGSSFTTVNDAGLFGPFGGVISGTVLVGDPPVEYVYNATAVDPDGDELSFSLVSGPDAMTIEADTGRLLWTVTSEQIGEHAVSIKVEDGRGGEDTLDWTIDVSGG